MLVINQRQIATLIRIVGVYHVIYAGLAGYSAIQLFQINNVLDVRPNNVIMLH